MTYDLRIVIAQSALRSCAMVDCLENYYEQNKKWTTYVDLK